MRVLIDRQGAGSEHPMRVQVAEQLPDALGSKGTGMKALKANVEKAVGVDILSNN